MIDAKLFRENPDIIKASQKKRGLDTKSVDEVVMIDKEWRESLKGTEELKQKRNQITKEIADLKKAKKNADKKIAEMQKLSKSMQDSELKSNTLFEKRDYLLRNFPNVLHESVPAGKDESENVEIRTWGKKPKFDFELKGHEEVAMGIDGLDMERAAKVAGARFWYLKNELAILDLSIERFAIDIMRSKGYSLIEPPFMMRRKPYEGVTSMADFEEVLYKIEGEDLYLIATSEHPMAAMYMDEVFNAKQLPIRMTGVSPCFRKEAGAHGKDTKGIFRVHQFNKIEQFIFCKPEESWKLHEELIKNAEEIFQKLELPYHIVNICTGDIGSVAAKKYDLEVWMPVQGKYREAVSGSNCTDYQANALNIRYEENTGNERKAVHTLNSTAIATTRAIVAILENFQQKDGSVKIPKALWPYTGFKEILPKKK
jgi:seryl-tRNA synthetase